MCDRRTFLCSAGASVAMLLLGGCGLFANQRERVSGSQVPSELVRVVALSRSLGEMVLLAGGELVGITDDGVDLSGISVKVASIGPEDEPSIEQILACNPKLVILHESTAAHTSIRAQLEASGIACCNVEVDSFDDYARYMDEFCTATGRSDLYQEHVAEVSAQIEQVVTSARGLPEESYLALRMSSAKCTVLRSDDFACRIFDDVGLRNVAEDGAAFVQLSVGAVVAANPDYVFVIPDGDPVEAQTAFERTFASRPGWKRLTAASAGRVYHMPQDLFARKPNVRWGEAYRYALDHRIAK